MKLDPTAVAAAVTLSAAALITALPVPSPSRDFGSGGAAKYDQALEERTSVPPLLNVFDDAPRAVAQTLLSSTSKVDTLSATSPEADELVSTRLSLGPAQDFRTDTTSSMATFSNRPSVKLLTHPSETSLVVQPARPVAQYGQTPTWLSRPQNPFAPESGLVKPQVGSTKSGFRRLQAAADASESSTSPSLRVRVSVQETPSQKPGKSRKKLDWRTQQRGKFKEIIGNPASSEGDRKEARYGLEKLRRAERENMKIRRYRLKFLQRQDYEEAGKT